MEDVNINYQKLSINYNLWLIGKGFDGFATVHRFSSDLHFRTLPSIIDGLWKFVLNHIHTAAAVNPVNLVRTSPRLQC